MAFDPTQFSLDLAAAASVYDEQRANVLCAELTTYLRERDKPYPVEDAKRILNILRKRRYFKLMQQVADCLIQNKQDSPTIIRQYAQSQIDRGNFTAAICTLNALKNDTANKGKRENSKEYAEACGLLGRVYKDLYVNSANSRQTRKHHFLNTAINYYLSVYKDNPKQLWQGINSVALIRRSIVDQVPLEAINKPEELMQTIAKEILAAVNNIYLDDKANMFDAATALEACICLGKYDDAIVWLMRFLNSDYSDAFELASCYRQLVEVWQLTTSAAPGNKILPPLKAELMKRRGSHLEMDIKEVVHEQLEALTDDSGYEKLLGKDSYRSLKWFQTCMQRASAVARIEDQFGDALGTGFVVRGGDVHSSFGDELMLLTNAHVVSSDESVSRALRPEKARANFELHPDNNAGVFMVEEVWTSPPSELDATLMRLAPAVDHLQPIPITSNLPKLDGSEPPRAYIIGHPQGRNLSFSIHDNHLLDFDERLIHYRSPTEPGSSGSPVFNAEWELIGLHHAGLRKMPQLNGKEGTYPANEGILINAIIQAQAQGDDY